MNNQNYYEETLIKIKELIKANEYEGALKILQEELKMPYIPMKYENEFHNLLELVKPHINNNEKNSSAYASLEDLMDMIMSEDKDAQVQALEMLGVHNLRKYKESLKSRIETWTEEDIIAKAFLFELLIEQQVDIDIAFRNNLIINPSKSVSIIATPEVAKLMDEVERITFQEPMLAQAAFEQVRYHLLLNYPLLPQDSVEWARQLVNVVRFMHGEQINLSEEELKIYEHIKR